MSRYFPDSWLKPYVPDNTPKLAASIDSTLPGTACRNCIVWHDEDDEPTLDMRQTRIERCAVCDCSNGHSLSCSTLRHNRASVLELTSVASGNDLPALQDTAPAAKAAVTPSYAIPEHDYSTAAELLKDALAIFAMDPERTARQIQEPALIRKITAHLESLS